MYKIDIVNLLQHIEPTDDFNDIKTYDFINKYLPLFNMIESNFNLIVKYSDKRYIIHKNNNLINDSYEYELSNGKITKIEDITDINYDINITPFSLKNGTLNSKKNIIAPIRA